MTRPVMWITLLLTGLLAPVSVHAQSGPPGTVPLALRLVPAGGASARSTIGWEREGLVYLPAQDVSLLLGAVKYWRPELGRLTLVVGDHEASVLEGSNVATLDRDQVVRLRGPVLMWEGRLLVPLDLLVDDTGVARSWLADTGLRYQAHRRTLSASVRSGAIEGASLVQETTGWKLVFASDAPIKFDRLRTQRSSFVILLRDLTYDPLLFPLPPEHDQFQGLRLRNLPEGVEVSFSAGVGSMGYALRQPDKHLLEVFLGFDERDLRQGELELFGAVRGLVPERIHLVALDAGHGGTDAGANLDRWSEAAASLDLCKRIATVLKLELEIDAVILREPQENLAPADRAQRANASGANLLISVHIHDRAGGPAVFVGSVPDGTSQLPRDAASLGFTEYGRGQAPYVGASRLFARSLVDALAGRMRTDPLGVFPEQLLELEGAAMPAVLMEVPAGEGGKGISAESLEMMADAVVEALRFYLLAGAE